MVVGIVGKPRGEDRRPLLGQVHAPARLRSRGRRPPQILKVRCRREVGLPSPCAGGQRAEGLHHDRLGLCGDVRSVVHVVRECTFGRVAEGQRRGAYGECRPVLVKRAEKRLPDGPIKRAGIGLRRGPGRCH